MGSIRTFSYLDNRNLDRLTDGPGRGKQQQQARSRDDNELRGTFNDFMTSCGRCKPLAFFKFHLFVAHVLILRMNFSRNIIIIILLDKHLHTPKFTNQCVLMRTLILYNC